MNSADRLKNIRSKLNLTQEKLADSIGLKRENVTNLESGKVKISTLHALALEYVHGINKDWLLNGNGEPFITSEQQINSIIDSPSPAEAKIIDEHIALIKRFKNPKVGKDANMWLVEIQDADRYLFSKAINILKKLWKTARVIKEADSDYYPEPNMENLEKELRKGNPIRREGGQKKREAGEKEE